MKLVGLAKPGGVSGKSVKKARNEWLEETRAIFVGSDKKP
ncbi:hypothetical protein JCM19241_3071 [Vibrio ishigakensis]|uniref:Uncharacterized protein n=1 Tax=Vibrio ishigakensis TaxID=1481914 RepID=A0A0B8Q508_9VIBR|nr:hypothetical protein JCM19241_3071 [Vibrio ishigakensis]